MTLGELTVGITVDLSGLSDGLSRAQEQVAAFGDWLQGSCDALAASAEPFADAMTSALAQVKAAGGDASTALERGFTQALGGLVRGAEGFRDFWRRLWQELLEIVLRNLTAMVSEGDSAAAVLQRTLGGLLGGSVPTGIVGGLLDLLGFDQQRRQPRTRYTMPSAPASEAYGALPTTTATAAAATRILSVAVRVEPGAVQLSPAHFDAESARQAARSLFEEIRHLFETEDLAEGLAQA
jgi:hypothetical protein